MDGLALYVHIPFCRQRCTYCDFCTWAGLDHLMEQYVVAVGCEIDLLRLNAACLDRWQVATLYLGGGTPSLLSADQVAAIVRAAGLQPGAEVTLEANPGTVDGATLAALRRAGINRLSLGMQSAHRAELELLGRQHDSSAVAEAVRAARRVGLANVSLDLIYGLPGQSLNNWRRSLEAALALESDHLSLYALTLEAGTALAVQVASGQLPEPDPDLAADMYDLARERLAAAGFGQYEISNWARPGMKCQHNLAYWRNQPYLGVGAGAWGHWPQGQVGLRLGNVSHPQAYLDRLRPYLAPRSHRPAWGSLDAPVSPACQERELVSRPVAMAETMFMGLRLVGEGVSRDTFAARFGCDPVHHYRSQIDRLARDGMVEWDSAAIRLTPRAVLISNSVLVSFVPDEPAGEGPASRREADC